MEVTPWNPVSRLGVALMALAPLSWWSAYLIQDAPLLKVALFCAGVVARVFGPGWDLGLIYR